MLSWFDQNPDRYWWFVCLVVAGSLFVLLRPLLRPDWKDSKGTDWRWGLVIFLVLIAGRWPTWFVTRELGSDESQLVAGAMTLRHDPVFWRSINGGTAGPLDFYALFPVGWIHGADDYFSARVTALCLIAAALILAHQIIAVVYGRLVARCTGFATLCFESLTLHYDLLHYSTELVPVCLLAAAFFMATRRFTANTGWLWNALGGLLLGSVAFAKIQALPLAGLLTLGWIAGEFLMQEGRSGDRRNRFLALGVGLCAPLLVCALFLTVTGQWRTAVVSYVLRNAAYVNADPKDISFVLLMFWRSSSVDQGLLVSWLAGGGLWVLLTLPLSRDSTRPLRIVVFAAVVFFLASFVCIVVPRRPFFHYWQLLVVPWSLVLGATTGLMMVALENQRSRFRCGVLCAALICSTAGLLYERAGCQHPYVGRLALYHSNPQGAVAKELMKYARPGESLGTWGWMSNFFVEAGLRQATRNAITGTEIPDNPFRDYYRDLYLTDLQRSAPPVFVDAVGPGNFCYEDRRLAHDAIFPELAAYIRTYYTQVADLHGSRIYVRNDRLAACRTSSSALLSD
jgi:hypothetical protein